MTSGMQFDCKLAHSDQIRKISNFRSIKELYEQVSRLFQIPADDILYCTLNTHNFRDMDAILSNFLSFGDLIVVHVCGNTRTLNLSKTQQFLGLTITDNGRGRAFVKRVKSDQQVVEENVKQGDHIVAINSESTLGWRHFEVAKAIRDVPKGASFTLSLMEPKQDENYKDLSRMPNERLDANHESRTPTPASDQFRAFSPDGAMCLDELLHSSLPIDRLLSKQARDSCSEIIKRADERFNQEGQSDENVDSYKTTIDKINSILESFIGINDNLLAIQIYRLARENKDSYSHFLEAFKSSQLDEFNFNDDIKSYLWTCATLKVTS